MELLKAIGTILLIVIVALLIIGLAIFIPAWVLWGVIGAFTGKYVSFWACVGVVFLIELLLSSFRL
ncbi:hypothetical protein CoNPh2_CDS0128 [Staphylococcus phage S-CoN_Ph2]|nr:hypothetical protein CoNPh1_CDS0030 [Staphylococcus phage S-CoN_Ph1]WNM51682.1 hypothetical protein CoNPh2_CDS0128 [Staphylococcus phage S-CoN_Ph2]WNM51844.1 hypothetical protein CoNPh3_CDS0130 [Staphylococcus phage S-CoN_Ph3]WNM51909.1 hypothetical protein CoNPh4_CDS0033 [Staphylococcus phage S-CoN_Ph4]WNM52092.1 hypothetical protein CoNPh5_CDS0046 [Staphylococcus phage S-CoN_Ph5]WNM52343.1 hypothetical protein CoNPh6_CDS0133 [Staphylococcus phage S-CoN_Ph6]WNM52590.1 hypothetical protein